MSWSDTGTLVSVAVDGATSRRKSGCLLMEPTWSVEASSVGIEDMMGRGYMWDRVGVLGSQIAVVNAKYACRNHHQELSRMKLSASNSGWRSWPHFSKSHAGVKV